jgi:hypothetical protein
VKETELNGGVTQGTEAKWSVLRTLFILEFHGTNDGTDTWKRLAQTGK